MIQALKEIPSAPVYRGVGKAYYAIERDTLIDQMGEEVKKDDQTLTVLKNTQQYVEKKAKETEDKLKELLEQAKSEQQ